MSRIGPEYKAMVTPDSLGRIYECRYSCFYQMIYVKCIK